MRNYLISLLRRLLNLVDREDPQFARAATLVIWADTQFPNVRGERKKHQVLNKLATEFPYRRLRDLSYLIEKALQEK